MARQPAPLVESTVALLCLDHGLVVAGPRLTTQPPRPATAEDPLEVLLIGDSLIGSIADGFGHVTDGSAQLHWTKDVRSST